MRTSRRGIAVVCALWTMAGACADVQDEELATAAESETETLEQRTPVTFPGATPGSGGAVPVGGTNSSGTNSSGTNSSGTNNNSGSSTPGGTTPAPRWPWPSRPANPSPSGNTNPSRPTTPSTPAPPVSGGSSGDIAVRDPNGIWFAGISASGTGCPSNTWQASLAPDGQTFTITFSSYELEAKSSDPSSKQQQESNCRIRVNMNSPSGLSYAVSKISYSGYAYLDPGVTAYHTAFYSFTGQTIRAVDGTRPRGEVNERFTGPYDGAFLLDDDVSTRDFVFSECGTTRALNINTGLILNNTSPARNGYINLAAVDGRVTGKIVLKLATRRCN